MAGSINKVILVGNLGKDPEVRMTQDGREIANFTMATSDSWKDKATGERKERTEWHRVVVFNESLARVAKNYLKKGSKVYVEGSLQTRKWVDQGGIERYTTEVVLQNYNGNITMLDGKGGSSSEGSYGESGGYQSSAPAAKASAPAASMAEELDDEIPF